LVAWFGMHTASWGDGSSCIRCGSLAAACGKQHSRAVCAPALQHESVAPYPRCCQAHTCAAGILQVFQHKRRSSQRCSWSSGCIAGGQANLHCTSNWAANGVSSSVSTQQSYSWFLASTSTAT
jgi:hypothetical protein